MERVESQEKWVETGEKFFMANCSPPIALTIYPFCGRMITARKASIFLL